MTIHADAFIVLVRDHILVLHNLKYRIWQSFNIRINTKLVSISFKQFNFDHDELGPYTKFSNIYFFLSSLKELMAAYNDLCGVPVEIFQLQNLEKLELQSNHIATLEPADSISRLGHHGKTWTKIRYTHYM